MFVVQTTELYTSIHMEIIRNSVRARTRASAEGAYHWIPPKSRKTLTTNVTSHFGRQWQVWRARRPQKMQTYGNPGHDFVSNNIPFMIPGFSALEIDVATNIEISL